MKGLEVDALIVGAGVAGATTARALTQQVGAKVALVEVGSSPSRRWGEQLSGAARAHLRQLRLWEEFVAAGHTPCYRVMSSWTSDEIQSRDSISNPYGCDWNLKPGGLGEMLRRGLEDQILWRTRVREVRKEGAIWAITLSTGASSFVVRARFLVDASGRAASLARRLGGRRQQHQNAVAILGITSAVSDAHSLTTESACDGWWYGLGLPGTGTLAGFVTDHSPTIRAVDLWRASLAITRTMTGLAGGDRPKRLWTQPAGTAVTFPVQGDGWLCVGDAAAAYDPISSLGLERALGSGLAAADAIARSFAGRGRLDYQAAVLDDFGRHLTIRRKLYRSETRWPCAAFWKARR